MKKNVFIFLFFSAFFNAQILEYFPPMQQNYKGGNVQFYKDFHNVLMEKKLKPCENKNEYYNFKVVIYPDSKIKYVKDEDSLNVAKNKCSYELSREVAKYLKDWNPAVVDGKQIPAIANFAIFPDDLFENYSENYDANNEFKNADYEGGINNFRKKIVQSIDLSRFSFKGTFKINVRFVIDANGKMSDVQMEESSGLKEFDEMILKSVAKIKNKWTPASIHGTPVKSHFKVPLVFNSP